ncbi:tetratricopeptide repeat protein [Kineothrix sp. MB12-C1]|uniref:tetratricopeptide repeat protein n=1 Tax=Kineothrix sp. MB12-C1 TaxID=3070215 RepID=UPI0027D2694B|nr:hypothetical protein [Kineothrix sp. MB12-C1]WMC91302.1 hypothetical protein RBB56_10440 [Kineothrix sp. MB12-C1]
MLSFFKNLFYKKQQNIERTTIVNSVVLQTGGDMVLDSELTDLLIMHKNDKCYLNQLIQEKLTHCETLILEDNRKDASRIIDTIYMSSLKSIDDANNDWLIYLKAVICVLSSDSENVKLLVDYLEKSSIYRNNIATAINLKNNSSFEFVMTDNYKEDHLFSYMLLHIFFNKSEWDYIISNFKPNEYSFHVQDCFYGLASFNNQNFVEAIQALDLAIKKRQLPKYSFYKALSCVYLDLEQIQEDDTDHDRLTSHYQKLINWGDACPELRDENLATFNLSKIRALLIINPETFLDEYSNLVQIQKKNINFRFQLGAFYQMQKLYDEALAVYTEILSEGSSQELSHRIIVCYLLQKNFSAILSFFEAPNTHKFSATITIYLIAIHNQNPGQFDNLFDRYFFSSCENVSDLIHFLELFRYSTHVKEELYKKTKVLKDEILLANKTQKIMLAFFVAEILDMELSKCFLASIHNYLPHDLEMVHFLLSKLSSSELREELAKWFVENNFKTPFILNILAENYIHQEKYVSALPLLKEAFTLSQEKNTAIYLVNLAALLDTVKIEDIQDSLYFLSSEKDPEILLIVAQTYYKFGFYDKAERLSYEAIYLLSNLDDSHLYQLYMSIHFNMLNGSSKKIIDFDRATMDVVIFLKPVVPESSEKNIADSVNMGEESPPLVICINQEANFCTDTYSIGALHVSKSNLLYLKLINKEIHEIVEYNGIPYEIASITNKYVYAFRHVLSKVADSSDGSFIKKISIDKDRDIRQQMRDVLYDLNPITNWLDLYHFKDNPVGTPIEWINSCGYDEYVHIVQYLLYSKEEVLYAGLNNISYDADQTYTITLSSLVILQIIGNLFVLDNYFSKIFISDTLLEFIKLQSENSSKTLVISPGKIGISDDGNLTLTPPDKTMPDFWNALYEIALKLNLHIITNDDRANFNRMHSSMDLEKLLANPKVHICQLDSFIVAQKNNSLLLSDDLFFRQLGTLLGIQSVNHTHLYSIIDIKQYISALTKLMETNFLYIPITEAARPLLNDYIKSISNNERKRKLYTELFPPDSFMRSILNQ